VIDQRLSKRYIKYFRICESIYLYLY
jgi:hypothetical protein